MYTPPAPRSSGNHTRKTVHESSDWKLNKTVSHSSNKNASVPSVSLGLKLSNGISKENVNIELNERELEALFNTVEDISVHLDNLY
ncbi:hypothetical protein P9112_000210 [Eukaryota sp. TZLM1-RC]